MDNALIFEASCIDCAITLTAQEADYYGYRCEDCERKLLDRINKWRHGEEDAELDEAFGA